MTDLTAIPGAKPVDRGRKLFEVHHPEHVELFEADLTEAAKKELAKLKESAIKTEAMLAKQILKEMMPKGLAGEGPMAEMAQDNFVDSIATIAAKSNAFGVARMLEKNVARTVYQQEAARLIIQNREQKP